MRGTLDQLHPELARILPQLGHPPLICFGTSEFVAVPVNDKDVRLRVIDKFVEAVGVGPPAE